MPSRARARFSADFKSPLSAASSSKFWYQSQIFLASAATLNLAQNRLNAVIEIKVEDSNGCSVIIALEVPYKEIDKVVQKFLLSLNQIFVLDLIQMRVDHSNWRGRRGL
jgi:hypothetical protein